MAIKKHIRKIFFVSCWLVIGAGILLLLIAAIIERNHKNCRGYEIDINSSAEADGQWFIDKKDVLQRITNNGAVAIKGCPIAQFNLRAMEEKLEKDVWIKDAELFLDNKQILQVRITEREPVARMFTPSGNSFYIDSSGVQLPLSDKLSARVPVFTNYPIEHKIRSAADSLLVQQVKDISWYILHHDFWMAQIAQIEITADRQFELLPTVGNHIVEFGDGTSYDKKFNRLWLFYKNVLGKNGMDRYNRIKVQYDKQVIGVKNEQPVTRYDSLQAAKAVNQLISEGHSLLQTVQQSDSIAAAAVPAATPAPARPKPPAAPVNRATQPRTPKAVMGRRH